MKRIVSLLLVLIVIISVSGCKSKQQAENAKKVIAASETKVTSSKLENAKAEDFPPGEFEHGLMVDYAYDPPQTIEDVVKKNISYDVFIGKVVDVEIIIPKTPLYHLHRHQEGEDDEVCGEFYRTDRNYEEYFLLDSNLYLYTVEIEKSINSVFTTEKTTIQMINEVPYKKHNLSPISAPHKLGERYILSGRLWQYQEKTVLREVSAFTSKIDSKGRIEGVGQDAEIMNEFGTVDNFMANKDIAKIFEKDYYLSDGYQKDYNLSSNTININSKDENVQKLISDGKKALPIDSKFKMPVKTDVIGDLSDDENRVLTNAEKKIQ